MRACESFFKAVLSLARIENDVANYGLDLTQARACILSGRGEFVGMVHDVPATGDENPFTLGDERI